MATMVVEMYDKAGEVGTALQANRVGVLELEARVVEGKAKQPLFERLGLTVLKARVDEHAGELEAVKRFQPFPLLGRDELSVWQLYLPTVYTTEKVDSRVAWKKPMAVYAFDQPPLEVLELWARLQSERQFEYYEIRTPERVAHPDPILLGWGKCCKEKAGQLVGPFLLARWGESLLPFAEIKARVMAPSTTWPTQHQLMETQQQLARLQSMQAQAPSVGTWSSTWSGLRGLTAQGIVQPMWGSYEG
jgi:hypothetical protein